jgi:hypothetical protein
MPVAPLPPTTSPGTQCDCRREALPDHLKDRIHFTDCCWLWFGNATKADQRTGKEYGLLHFAATTTRAHRATYEVLRETRLDQTDVIHHRCRQTLCVHPCHLLVTDSAGNAFFERLAVCCSGRHPLHHSNRAKYGQCRACMREYKRRRKWSQQGKPTPIVGSVEAEYLGCRCDNGVLCPLHPGDRTLPRRIRIPLVGTLTCCADVAATRPHRGPTPRGSANAMTALTEEDVEDIRRRSAHGEDAQLLAAEFGMTRHNLNRILRGKTWGHVGGPTKPTMRRYTPTHEEIENLRRLYRQIRRGIGNAETERSSAPFADFAAKLVARGAVRSALSRALGLHPNAVGLFLARRESRCPLHTPAAVAGRPEPPTRPHNVPHPTRDTTT